MTSNQAQLKVKAISARTTYPNTPETDMFAEVLHTVCVEVGGQEYEIQLSAPCPLTALEKASKLSPAEVTRLHHLYSEKV